MIVARPGTCPGWDFAVSFELGNAADSGISRVGPMAVLGASPAHGLSKVNPLAACTVRWSPGECAGACAIAAAFHLQFSQRIVSQ
jgi:hypothetical protein